LLKFSEVGRRNLKKNLSRKRLIQAYKIKSKDKGLKITLKNNSDNSMINKRNLKLKLNN